MYYKHLSSGSSWLSLLAAAAVTTLAAAGAAAPVLRVSVDQRGDFAMIGNTFGWDCGAMAPAPVVGNAPTQAMCGANTVDSAPDVYWRSNDNGTDATADTTITSAQARTQAMLNLPAGAQVTHAFLYWAGNSGALPNEADDTVTLDRPDGQGGVVFSNSVMALPADIVTTSNENSGYFQSIADVTALVQAQGNGVYRVSGLTMVELPNVDATVSFGSWTLVVLYRLASAPPRNITVFDGLDLVTNITSPVTAQLSGFVVPQAGFDAKLGVIAYEGDEQFVGDRLLFGTGSLNNTDSVSNNLNPANNFFNSTRTSLGMAVSNVGDLPQLTGAALSMSSVDFDVVDITDRVTAGQTSADIAATTSGDVYFLGAFITSISTFKPDFATSTKEVSDVNGPPLLANEELLYTITATNSGNDVSVDTVVTDVLPAGVTYQPGSLQIVSGGPGAMVLTDGAGDDAGEYDAATNTVTVRIGAGANATQGGNLAVGESTVISFSVTVASDASGTISNQATIEAGGQQGAPAETTPTDGNGGQPGTPPTDVVVTNCPTGEECIDSDGDGLIDSVEITIGSDPNDADSDDDGVLDGAEPAFDKDTDGDGLINVLDADSDNDGLTDGTELGLGCDDPATNNAVGNCTPDGDSGQTTTDPLDADSDDGGVSDGAEDINLNGVVDGTETDPNVGADDASVIDSDGDGLSDGLETQLGTDPNNADSDNDGLLDGDEPNFSLDSDGDGTINALDPDSDNDGVFDGTESGNGCDHPDTDVSAGNCIPDGDGGATKTSPLDPDTDHGGVSDGDEDSNHNGVVDAGERDPLNAADDIVASGGGPGGTPLGDSLEGGAFACAYGGKGKPAGPVALLWLAAAAWLLRRRRD